MKNIHLAFKLVALVWLILFAFVRCGSQLTVSTEPTSGSFTSVYSILKSNNCVSCHIPTGSATVDSGVKLDFTSQTTAYSTITSKSVTGIVATGTCGSVKIVTTGSPTKSYLAGILFSDYQISNFAGVSGCTPINTHLSLSNLSTANKTSITTWITNGIKND